MEHKSSFILETKLSYDFLWGAKPFLTKDLVFKQHIFVAW